MEERLKVAVGQMYEDVKERMLVTSEQMENIRTGRKTALLKTSPGEIGGLRGMSEMKRSRWVKQQMGECGNQAEEAHDRS